MRIVKYVLCVCAVALLLAGCGGSQPRQSTSDAAPAAPPAAEAGPGAKRAAGPQAAGGTAAGGAPTAGQVNVPAPTTRSVVYTANLRVRAKNVDNAATTAKQLVTAAGGYVENETGSSSPVTANLTFKVPSDRYGAVLGELTGQLGTKLSLQQQAEDVTEQVADVDSRVKSAQATLQTFRKLLNRANTVGEVLNVEQEITQREADLESLQARQKSLAQQTRYGTVTLQLEAPGEQPTKQSHDGGFTGGLKAGWRAFVAVLWAAATVLGWLLPFLVVAAVIGLPAWRLRRSRRKAPGTPPGRPAEPASTLPPAPPVL
ncbi:MAG: hypothetical protein QOE54_2290 [Streptosporangiaceae bacterium]|jgi:hypothetical protein|nr:hypothetical protein [Streptosporangiaceae bacterium]MDX6429924.1 hypothetical protein [Streptosporangiaceae bacterium]